MEQWKRVTRPPFDKWYEVSNLGRVRRIPGRDCAGRWRPGGIMSQHDTGAGYLQTMLNADRTRKFWLVHHLVALAFIGEPAGEIGRDGWQINHRNGLKFDNCPRNLEWCLASENQRHASAFGLKPRGAQHYKSRLTEDDVLEIRKAYVDGSTLTDLAYLHHCSPQNIYRIVNGLTWKHI